MGELVKNDNELGIDLEELIAHIDIVEYIGQFLELEEKNGEYWTNCPFHDGDDNASFAVSQEKQMWFCQGCKQGGNVYHFVRKYNKISPGEAVIILCQYAKLDVNDIPAPPDMLRYLRKLKRTFNKKTININHKVLNKDCMLIYDKKPIKEWLAEGIDQFVLDRYDVRYDRLDNSIVFPIYDNIGNIINIKKRTLQSDLKASKRPKYTNLYKIGKLDYLYGFAQNSDSYDEYKSIILFEGEKSVMKMESNGMFNSVALSTSSISREQANTLIKTGKQIVIALDKGIGLEHIYRNFEYLIRFTNTYLIYDKYGLLEDKDSPIDKGVEIFSQLYDKRIKL